MTWPFLFINIFMGKRLTTKEFISKAKEVHGDLYDYSKVEYINSKIKVIIGCKEHGDFKQIANDHLNGSGCNKCGGSIRLTTKEFIKKAKLVHGDRYDYSKVTYINNNIKVIIICKEHGDFEQTSKNHFKGAGCPECAGTKRSSTKEFITKVNEIHGDLYDYSKVEYVNNSTKVIIGCKEHGDFEQIPNSHLNGNGCPECSIEIRSKINTSNTTEFIQNAKEIHGNLYDYSKVNYINSKIKVIIGCKEHGDFEQKPNKHLNGQGCPKCSKQGYSKKAITWLNQISEKENIYIQHAENEGEYHIPGTNYKADGFCKETNTIYEFYGDIWHGNLNLFEENELCHPYKDESASSLYMKTINREEEIRKLGYNLITIWENEYKGE